MPFADKDMIASARARYRGSTGRWVMVCQVRKCVEADMRIIRKRKEGQHGELLCKRARIRRERKNLDYIIDVRSKGCIGYKELIVQPTHERAIRLKERLDFHQILIEDDLQLVYYPTAMI